MKGLEGSRPQLRSWALLQKEHDPHYRRWPAFVAARSDFVSSRSGTLAARFSRAVLFLRR